MAYTSGTLSVPNDIIVPLREYAVANGWTVEHEADDLPIDGSAATDGRRLVLKSPSGSTYAHIRTANGANIFPDQNTGGVKYGVGLTCSTEYTESPASGLWYDQTGIPKTTGSRALGVGIPLQNGVSQNYYINHVADPAEMIILSVEVVSGVFQHLAFGEAYKIGTWTGGALMSASRNSYYMFAADTTKTGIETNSNPLFGLSEHASTFLRCNIDSAPLRSPEVLWASGGPNTAGADTAYTGKLLGLPVMKNSVLSLSWRPQIPHYGYLQSQTTTDPGRNVNTLNCISVNLPLALYVLRDPDGLANFSQCGYVPGVYFISTRNISPAALYSISYPESGVEYQVFPYTSRGGLFGYDGFSIKQ